MALIAPEIGIDLGTSNTMVYVRGRGIVVSEPTIVVIDSDNKHNVRAVGGEDGGRCGRKGRLVMNNRPEIDRYVLTEMDEEGNVWCEYSGKNNFSFHTMTDLLVSFRVFRIAMHVLAFMFGQVVYKLLSQLF